MGDVLAREAASEHLDGLDGFPVDAGDVSVVGDSGPVAFEDGVAGLLAGVGIVLTVPGEAEACLFESEVEAAASGEERSDTGFLSRHPS